MDSSRCFSSPKTPTQLQRFELTSIDAVLEDVINKTTIPANVYFYLKNWPEFYDFVPATRKLISMMKKTESEVTINAPWGNIKALTWGRPSDPPVLLCHGKLDACSGFRPLVASLPDMFYYVSIDLPGNGRSDHLPRGSRYTVVDLVAAVTYTVKYFNWKSFAYIGHSLGVPIGKLYNIAYPGLITCMVELDPIPAHHTWPTTIQGLHDWFHEYYQFYDEKKYVKFNSGIDTAPKYTYEQAQKLIMGARSLSKEASEHVLERVLVPAGDGLFRFTYDQRMKEVTVLPFSGDNLRQLYTATKTPTFGIYAQDMIDVGCYTEVPFVLDNKAWPNKNYTHIVVKGGHDVHINDPECMSKEIAKFLLAEFKAKL